MLSPQYFTVRPGLLHAQCHVQHSITTRCHHTGKERVPGERGKGKGSKIKTPFRNCILAELGRVALQQCNGSNDCTDRYRCTAMHKQMVVFQLSIICHCVTNNLSLSNPTPPCPRKKHTASRISLYLLSELRLLCADWLSSVKARCTAQAT